jgi:hypothetical protein
MMNQEQRRYRPYEDWKTPSSTKKEEPVQPALVSAVYAFQRREGTAGVRVIELCSRIVKYRT